MAKNVAPQATAESVTRLPAAETERKRQVQQLPVETREQSIRAEHVAFSQFLHDRFFNSLQYVQFLTQRTDHAVQTYLTVLTASLGALIVLVTSSAGKSVGVLASALAAIIFVIGVVGVVTAVRLVAYRRMRNYEMNRLYELQQYFREINSATFDKLHVGIGEIPRGVRYWYTPLVWVAGIFHAILPAISVAILSCLLVSSFGYPIERNLWWILLMSGMLCLGSVVVYVRVYRSQVW